MGHAINVDEIFYLMMCVQGGSQSQLLLFIFFSFFLNMHKVTWCYKYFICSVWGCVVLSLSHETWTVVRSEELNCENQLAF